MSNPVMVNVGEVARFIRGITFKPTDTVSPFSPGSIVCMRTKNVQADLDQSDLIAVPKSFVKRKEQYIYEGDILVSSANSWNLVGKCSWVPELQYEATAGGFISILRGDKQKVDVRYLYYWLNSPTIQHNLRLCGRQTTNISNLSFERSLELEIPLPPLTEQKRIVAILDKADAIRRKRQAAIQLADDFLRATFLDMFGDPVTNPKGWKVRALESVCVSKQGIKAGPFGSALKKETYTTSGYRVYGQEQVIGGDFSIGDYYIDQEKYEEMSVYAVQPGDLLISLVGSIGNTIIVPKNIKPGIINPRLLRIRTNKDKLNSAFFQYLLKQPNAQAELEKYSHGGTMAVLNASMMKALNIIDPPINKQNSFSEAVEKQKKIVSKLTNSYSSLGALFNSLNQRAFRGEL